MIYNRIGDAGFLVALFLIFERTGSLEYHTVFAHLGRCRRAVARRDRPAAVPRARSASPPRSPSIPWLADAMEGPTPVSALIHAATMVTAGVYLMCRINPILHLAPDAAHVDRLDRRRDGACSAATIACAQTDIKKVLAYSTVSQLGYMFLAAGIGAYVAAIFLMLTHAFYKALLFLGAGSVIHAMDDEQDIKTMGALRAVMPLTAVTFLIGWLSIAGVPPFSGFWSKGDVLLNAYAVQPGAVGVGALTAVLTAYYMGRAYLLVFSGEQRWVEAQAGRRRRRGGELMAAATHPHDPRWVMSVPAGRARRSCRRSAGSSTCPFHPTFDFLDRWLSPVFGSRLLQHHCELGGRVGLRGHRRRARAGRRRPRGRRCGAAPSSGPRSSRLFCAAWFIDWAYDRFIARPSTEVAVETSSVVEAKGIDGAVNGVAVARARLAAGSSARSRPATCATTRSGSSPASCSSSPTSLTRAS